MSNFNNIINMIRLLSIEMIQKANSGHPGMPLGCAPMMFILWFKIMKFNPNNPEWLNRDRFILSNGHGCSLLYSCLYLSGFKVTLDDLKNFRQLGSITPGHPEKGITPGIEVSTGPLGQGFANGVGMALASKQISCKFNQPGHDLVNHNIYVMCGDGCLMEGISYESASLAGHLKLNNLIVLYDDNKITIDGSTDLTFTEDVTLRFVSMGWSVFEVSDGNNDLDKIEQCLLKAQNSDKPSLIRVKTTIGFLSNKEGSNKSHGSPLGEEETTRLRNLFGFGNYQPFEFPKELIESTREKIKEGLNLEYLWENKLKNYSYYYPEKYKQFKQENSKQVPNHFLPRFDLDTGKIATRDISEKCLQTINDNISNLIIGSADLGSSNKTLVSKNIFSSSNYHSTYINYGIREHAMAAISNGISTYNIISITSTFLVFINYCLSSIRMSALSRHKVIYVLTHDSVALGEDGPTHQPIESLSILRSIPNLLTFRPADGNEVSIAYSISLNYEGPSCICLARQTTPQLPNKDKLENIKRGAYLLYQHGEDRNLKLIILATGSEVCSTMNAIEKYNIQNIRLVSIPCLELYNLQNEEYKQYLFPPNIPKMSFEAGLTSLWSSYADYCYGINQFGKSGKGEQVIDYFDLSPDKIYEKIIPFFQPDDSMWDLY